MPHLKVTNVLSLVTVEANLKQIVTLGLVSRLGMAVHFRKCLVSDGFVMFTINEFGLYVAVPVSVEVLANVWMKETKYHEFIGNPMTIDFGKVDHVAYVKKDPDEKPTEEINKAAVATACAILLLVGGLASYKVYSTCSK
jgi:hypothetical protein